MRSVPCSAHRVTSLVFDAGQPYEKFRARYEATVPVQHRESTGRHIRQPGTAQDHGGQPHGFFLYWRTAMTTGLRPGTAYLMGSHCVSETSGGSDPAIMLGSLLLGMRRPATTRPPCSQ
jgi:hypothetical protein